MASSTDKAKLPVRLVLSGLGAALLLAATVLAGVYLGSQTQQRFQDVGQSWQTFTAEAERRGALLSRIRGHLGYGGIIHNFKNYVLRQDQRYLDSLNRQFKDFENTVEEYRKSGATPAELDYLKSIEDTIALYRSKLPVAQQAARENWPPARTDSQVRVDDSGAVTALVALEAYWWNKHQASTKDIARAVDEGEALVTTGFRFLAGLAFVALLLYGLFYLLQAELRQTIGMLSNELRERRIAEHEAKKFQRAVDQSPATIIMTDTQGNIEYVNQKFCDLTEYSADEVIGKTPRLLQSGDVSGDDYVALRQQLVRGEEWRGTFRNRKKSGQPYWAKTAILPLRDDLGRITHFIGVGEDQTERRKARDHIHRAQRIEAVSMLASGVAHDFNNVLTTILGNVHLARLDAPDKGDFSEELEQIEVAAKRARNLVGQIFAFARRQSGEAVAVRVNEVVEEVTHLLQASVQPNIVITCEVEDTDLVVKVDPTRLHQVIMNLSSNAAEAIGPQGGRITLKVELHGDGEAAEKQVLISVCDDGPGIPDDLKSKIFDPFFTTKTAGKGTGLGLSVVANLVGEMGGQIDVASVFGQGTTFTVRLPLSDETVAPRTVSGDLPSGTGDILLIDDEVEVAATCAKLLRRLGYDVEVFNDPLKAMQVYKSDPDRFELVITDLVMPGLPGSEVCRIVRELRPACPLVAYSAYQPEGIDFDKAGIMRFMHKPIEPAQLARIASEMTSLN